MEEQYNKVDEIKKEMYSSAELLQQSCFEDYHRLLNTYDKIYEKINFALAFCGVVLFVIVGTVDYMYLVELFNAKDSFEVFTLLIYTVSSFVSAILIILAVIQLLLLMRSKEIVVFNSIDIRNEGIYKWSPQDASTWLIDKNTLVVSKMRPVVNQKQKKFDAIMIKIVISLILCAISMIIKKGIGA